MKWILWMLLICSPAGAQMSGQWGMGMYGGMQGCGTQVQAGQGAMSETDDIRDAEDRLKTAQRELQSKKREKKTLDRDLERSRKDVEAVVAEDYSDFVFEHIENARDCREYKGLNGDANDASSPEASMTEGNLPVPGGATLTGNLEVSAFQTSEWSQLCDPSRKGAVFPAVCDGARFRQQDGDGRGDITNCKKGLAEYRKNYQKSQKLQREIENLQRDIERAKDDMKDAKQAMIDDIRSGNSSTEGGICVDCMAHNNNYNAQPAQNQTNWANVAANVGTGLLAMYAGYQTNKMVAQYNSNLGYPTQSYPAWGYGLPYFANGIYGALSGGTGQGAFACGGSGNMTGGAFGYPNGMFGNMMGGGMYAGGYGNMMTGGYPMASGMMMGGGYPMAGMMMGGYGSMTGMMMSNGMMMGSYGMMSSGMMMNSGLMMGNYGLMASGMMSSGMMMGSYGMMSSGMMMSSYSLQLQQMQMQAYQSYLQQQTQKYQTMSGLQQELYSLLYRIQNVQSGYYGTSSYLGTTSSTGGTITGGSLGTTIYSTPSYLSTGGTISGR